MEFLKHRKHLIFIFSSFLLLTLAAIYHIYFPFDDDQAYFNLAAKKMHAGSILYKDFWDIKQPGIFYFYLLGGSVFSFTEFGIHFFELVYWTVFSIILVYLSNSIQIFKNSFLNYLLPFFTVGLYLILTDVTGRTQNDILVSAPLTLFVFIIYKYADSNKIIPFIIAGLLVSIVLFYKLPFLLIIGSIVIYYMFVLVQNKICLRDIIFKKAIPTFLGFCLLPSIYFIFVMENNLENIISDIYFLMPLKLKGALGLKSTSLFFKEFSKMLALTFPFSLFALIIIIKNFKEKSQFINLLSITLVAGIFVIYLHPFNWFYYQLITLFPIGILSLVYLDKVLENGLFFKKKNSLVVMVILSLIVSFYISKKYTVWNFNILVYPIGLLSLIIIYNVHFFQKKFIFELFFATLFIIPVLKLSVNSFFYIKYSSIENGVTDRYKQAYNKKYLDLKSDAIAILNDSSKYKIHVFGDPLIYYLTNRSSDCPTLACYVLEGLNESQWIRIKKEILNFQPKYIYIEKRLNPILNLNGLLMQIKANYNVKEAGKIGQWYEIKK